MTPPNNSSGKQPGVNSSSSGSVNAGTGRGGRSRNPGKGNGSGRGSVSNKRRASFWDPIYDPQFRGTSAKFDWDTSNVTGIKYSECTADALKSAMENAGKVRWTLKGIKFENCDFRGDFNSLALSFNECQFENCDFGSANWVNVKFSGCKFSRASLSLATFDKCQFIDCSWFEIGFSGTETKLFETTISNPWKFIMSAYTNTDKNVLDQRGGGAAPAYQIMRLEETKVKVARVVLSNSEKSGDDKVYYEAVKTYLIQSLVSRRTRASYDIRTHPKMWERIRAIGTYSLSKIELGILRLSGLINAWGYSLARPALVGLLIILLFSGIYKITGISCNQKLAIMTSFDVSLLVGYTKHASEESTWAAQVIYGVNALAGLWWYAIFVPTVINRISRVR
jgi:hypothetical protein